MEKTINQKIDKYDVEVMPKKPDNCGMKPGVLDVVIAVEDYLS